MAARDAYGRLVALVTRRTGDVAGAEDALSEAFVAALERWPRDGVPDNPQGWLLAVARRRHVDQVRHSEVQRRLAPALQLVAEELS
ncbi:MAG: sigma factor, partial [Myxococcota bacterium]